MLSEIYDVRNKNAHRDYRHTLYRAGLRHHSDDDQGNCLRTVPGSDSGVTTATYYFENPTGGAGGTGGGASFGTPPADSGNGLDPRRIGVRALGSYWGDAGENLDTTSGNLSFANPLIKPFGRGGWSLPFVLSYNSQMWRHDLGGDWLLGADIGYGMGWRLQVGSAGRSCVDGRHLLSFTTSSP